MKNNMTLTEQMTMLNSGEITSVELVKGYIERIRKYDGKINSFLHIDEEGALKQAEILDEERRRGEIRGKIHGAVIGIKDNINVYGLPMTCGSKFLEGFVSPYDATVTEKIKSNGGIIIGKTNMDEFAMGSANEYSAYGSVANPYDYTRVPGGSSGGSAAAVAAGFVPVALGTDTGGSVRQPAAFCNLVGLKPTYGRISRYGVTAFASTLDQVGVLSHSVKDSARMLEVLSGMDKFDSTSFDAEVPDFVSEIHGNIEGLKIAIPRNFFYGLDTNIREVVENQIEVLKSKGAIFTEIDLNIIPKSLEVYYIVACAEASSNLSRFDGIRFGKRSASYESIPDLYKESRSQGFGSEVKRRIMLGTYVLSAGYSEAYYQTALKVRSRIIKEFDDIFEKFDAIIGPSTPFLPSKIGEKHENVVDVYLNDLYTVPANIAGIPAISVPCGFTQELPVGIQIMAKNFDEKTLFNVAQAIEESNDSYKNFAQLKEDK